jgi:hypothetical protein
MSDAFKHFLKDEGIELTGYREIRAAMRQIFAASPREETNDEGSSSHG